MVVTNDFYRILYRRNDRIYSVTKMTVYGGGGDVHNIFSTREVTHGEQNGSRKTFTTHRSHDRKKKVKKDQK